MLDLGLPRVHLRVSRILKRPWFPVAGTREAAEIARIVGTGTGIRDAAAATATVTETAREASRGRLRRIGEERMIGK